MIHTHFALLFTIFGEVLSHHDTFLENSKLNKTVSGFKNCCLDGRYDIKSQSCIGHNKNSYPFTMLCRELIPMSSLEDGSLQPGDVDNACMAEIYSENTQIISRELFLCDEYENCCTSGQFNPNTSTCVGATTAKYTFTLYCRKVVLDQGLEWDGASMTSEDKYEKTLITLVFGSFD